MNTVNLIGRLSKKPELRQTSNNKSVCEFSIAINRIGKDETDFINCTVWEKQAENLAKYQDKGSLIAVNGSIRTEKYQNDKGETRYKTYVLANNVEYLSSKSSNWVQNVPTNVEEEKDPFEEMAKQVAMDEFSVDEELPF